LLATFTVSNLADSGPGSLRQAIVNANVFPGADTINFTVSGTIKVGHTSLPAITDTVAIDGTTAPKFAGTPVVTVDFRNTAGLNFAAGADGSTLKSLSLLNAGNAGVTLNASHITVQGNYIGVAADGRTVAGNHGDGVQINPTSHDNLIGELNPVTGVTYYNSSSVGMQPVSGWQGIRDSGTTGQYLITGTSNSNGLLYVGPISGVGGTSYAVNVPGAASTSVYGPDVVAGNVLRLVGSYRNGQGDVNGFVFQGTTSGLTDSNNYRTIAYPGATYTYVHSTMGDLAVGNADGPEGNAPIGTGHAFIYSHSQDQIITDIVYPDSTSTTAYGIWHNEGTSYTIVGGYTKLLNPGTTVAAGYMVDYDAATGEFSHWTSISAPGVGPNGEALATHFEGISSPRPGVYTLAATQTALGTTTPLQASLATVMRTPDGGFDSPFWVNLNYPGSSGVVTSNSVAGNQVVGIALVGSSFVSYQATVDLGFQLSNVISGNDGNGVGIYGSNDNRVAMNHIGTDATGTLPRGNGQNGILVTNGALRNIIGGQVSDGNSPTQGVIVRPPQGNLISGNRGNGVLINNGSIGTILSGNFVGTAASGVSPLGNRLDGVAIENAPYNFLLGTTVGQAPFAYYNVLSGNGGNGLRVTNSDNVYVYANFMGAGADNATVVPNAGDGILVSGTSRNTQVGNIIPLGNVTSGNGRHGIEVTDFVSGFVSFNTFAGVFAFAGAAPNRLDGILVTSRGGNNLIRTSIVAGNLGNGIEIGGDATGVQVTDTAVGLQVTDPAGGGGSTFAVTPIPNWGSGIKISGRAHGNAIGGFQPSIEPQVTIGANGRYGIEMTDLAYGNTVFHTYIGTNYTATAALGNRLGGVYLGPGTLANNIGGPSAALRNLILFNGGDGVTVASSNYNRVTNNVIAANFGSGVVLAAGLNNLIGWPEAEFGNVIVNNFGFGLFALGDCTGSVVRGNTILSNAQGNVDLSRSHGIIFVP
jgi:hypothetical protein